MNSNKGCMVVIVTWSVSTHYAFSSFAVLVSRPRTHAISLITQSLPCFNLTPCVSQAVWVERVNGLTYLITHNMLWHFGKIYLQILLISQVWLGVLAADFRRSSSSTDSNGCQTCFDEAATELLTRRYVHVYTVVRGAWAIGNWILWQWSTLVLWSHVMCILAASTVVNNYW